MYIKNLKPSINEGIKACREIDLNFSLICLITSCYAIGRGGEWYLEKIFRVSEIHVVISKSPRHFE